MRLASENGHDYCDQDGFAGPRTRFPSPRGRGLSPCRALVEEQSLSTSARVRDGVSTKSWLSLITACKRPARTAQSDLSSAAYGGARRKSFPEEAAGWANAIRRTKVLSANGSVIGYNLAIFGRSHVQRRHHQQSARFLLPSHQMRIQPSSGLRIAQKADFERDLSRGIRVRVRGAPLVHTTMDGAPRVIRDCLALSPDSCCIFRFHPWRPKSRVRLETGKARQGRASRLSGTFGTGATLPNAPKSMRAVS